MSVSAGPFVSKGSQFNVKDVVANFDLDGVLTRSEVKKKLKRDDELEVFQDNQLGDMTFHQVTYGRAILELLEPKKAKELTYDDLIAIEGAGAGGGEIAACDHMAMRVNEMLESSITGKEIQDKRIEFLRAIWKNYSNDLGKVKSHKVEAMPEAENLLKFLNGSEIPRGIATSSSFEVAKFQLRTSGLLRHIDNTLVIGSDHPVLKGQFKPAVAPWNVLGTIMFSLSNMRGNSSYADGSHSLYIENSSGNATQIAKGIRPSVEDGHSQAVFLYTDEDQVDNMQYSLGNSDVEHVTLTNPSRLVEDHKRFIKRTLKGKQVVAIITSLSAVSDHIIHGSNVAES